MNTITNAEANMDAQVREPFLNRLVRAQPFWVFVALVLLCLILSLVSSPFATAENFSNVTLNFAFIGIIALGMTTVVMTTGIDLSVGSVMGLCGIVTGLVLEAGYPNGGGDCGGSLGSSRLWSD